MKKNIMIREAFNQGLRSLQENYVLWAAIVFISLFIGGIQYTLKRMGDDPIFSLLLIIVSLFQIIIWLGTLNIAIKLADGKQAVLSDLFMMYKRLLNFLVSSAVYTFFILSVPLIFLLIVTFFHTMQFISAIFFIAACVWVFFITMKNALFEYILVDKDLGPINALRKSREITRGAILKLFCFYVLVTLFNIIGFCCLLIGLFVTIPITLVANAHVYRQLEKQ
jgi:uncharacterized membrane protein